MEKSQANWALFTVSYNYTYNSVLHLQSILNSLSLHSLKTLGIICYLKSNKLIQKTIK